MTVLLFVLDGLWQIMAKRRDYRNYKQKKTLVTARLIANESIIYIEKLARYRCTYLITRYRRILLVVVANCIPSYQYTLLNNGKGYQRYKPSKKISM